MLKKWYTCSLLLPFFFKDVYRFTVKDVFREEQCDLWGEKSYLQLLSEIEDARVKGFFLCQCAQHEQRKWKMSWKTAKANNPTILIMYVYIYNIGDISYNLQLINRDHISLWIYIRALSASHVHLISNWRTYDSVYKSSKTISCLWKKNANTSLCSSCVAWPTHWTCHLRLRRTHVLRSQSFDGTCAKEEKQKWETHERHCEQLTVRANDWRRQPME